LDHAKQTGQYDIADQSLIKSLQTQLDSQQASEKAQQQFLGAASLIGDLGQLGAVTGKSLNDLGEQLHIPLDKLASFLGTDAAGLQQQFAKQEEMAQAALDQVANGKTTNELLADINATLAGKPLPFDPNTIINDTTNPIGKSSGHVYAPPGGGSAQPASKVEVSSPQTEKLLGDLIREIQAARREGVISNRNTAGAMR